MLNDRPNKRGPVTGGDVWAFLAVAGVVVGIVALWMVAWVSAALAGLGHGGPGQWLLGQGAGPRWSPEATGWAALFSSLLLGALVMLGLSIRSAWKGREWTDSMARFMSNRQDLEELTYESVSSDTERLGSETAGDGIRLAKAVLTSKYLYGTYEWSQLWIMGTRAGKTRSVAVPTLVEHAGAAVTTSNKSDIVYLTRGPRSELGRVWIQDPQSIYGEVNEAGLPTWWWNPLSFVTTIAKAEQLAGIWLASRVTGGGAASTDAYFEPMGRELLADLLFAAALEGEQITRVLDWLNFPDGRPNLSDPVEILRRHGHAVIAGNVLSKINAAADERSGIFGTARSACGFLRSPEFIPWITRQGEHDDRPEFDPAKFVRTNETLYLLSKEGAGSARAITGALTAAVYDAAELWSERNGGRLRTPMIFCLDEAANVCRWPELPGLISHAGSRGIILQIILQSRTQGVNAWGEHGMGMMVSAVNLLVVGRGINDDDHLAGMAKLIGDRQIRDTSLTVGTRGQRSTSASNRDERIFTEADLRALPRGRAVLFAAGSRPVLVKLMDYSERECGDLVEASKAAFKKTLDDFAAENEELV